VLTFVFFFKNKDDRSHFTVLVRQTEKNEEKGRLLPLICHLLLITHIHVDLYI